MSDMTREEAINECYQWLQDIHIYCCASKHLDEQDKRQMEMLNMAVSDMKRVEKLENENKSHAQLFEQQAEIIKNNNAYIAELEKSYLLLQNGIEKVKAELSKTDFDFGDFYDNTEEIRKIIMNVFSKHLGGM